MNLKKIIINNNIILKLLMKINVFSDKSFLLKTNNY
jgi:hypothetical protein